MTKHQSFPNQTFRPPDLSSSAAFGISDFYGAMVVHLPSQSVGHCFTKALQVVGNPMYDPAGMLVAMAAMGASKTQADTMSTKLNGGESLMAADVRVQAMKEAYAGRGDGGIETDGGWNEDVL